MADSVEDLNLVPPQNAQDNAQKVLDWRDEHGEDVNGMTRTGWVRANQLAKGEELSPEIVKRMAQFNRHRKNKKVSDDKRGSPWKDAGHVAWLGWGGDEGIDWAMRMSERITSIENTGQDTITTLSHKHVEDEDEEVSEEETVENSAITDMISDSEEEGDGLESAESVDYQSKEISSNTYNGYFEGKDFDNEDWAQSVDRLREIYGSARSFMTRIVRHEASGHGREENVPIFEEPIDSDTVEKFADNIESNVDEETFERVVEDMEKLDNVIKRLFFRMVMHDDYMHDRDDFEVEQLLSSDETVEENAAYSTLEDCIDDKVSSGDFTEEEAADLCMDIMSLESEDSEELDQVSEGDKVRWDASEGNTYGVVDTVETEGSVSAEPEGPEMEGTEDEPAVKIQVYDVEDGEWTGTETYVVHRFDALNRIDDFPEEESEENAEEDLAEKVSDGEVDTEGLKSELKESFESEIREELQSIKQDITKAQKGGEVKSPEDELIDESLELENLKKKKELREQKLQLIKDLRNGEV